MPAAGWLFAGYPNLGNWAFLTLAVPPTIGWLMGFRPSRAKDVLLLGVVGGIGSSVYVAATWRVWPGVEGKVPQDAAGIFELTAFLVIWVLVMGLAALLTHLLTGRREQTA